MKSNRAENELHRDEYGLVATLANGRVAEVLPLTFGRGRIALVSETCRFVYDDMW